jgi:hypothetical protein
VAGVVLLLAGGVAAPARAQSLPFVNLGSTSFGDGSLPAGAGVYIEEYVQYYHADRFRDAGGNTVPFPSPRLDAWASLTQFIFVGDIDLPLVDAKPLLNLLLPAVSPDLDFGAPGPFPTDNGAGLGDLVIGPALQFNAIEGPNGPLFAHRLEADFILPVGKYSSAHEVNPGAGFFYFDPHWEGTLFLGPKVKVSYRAHYLWNGRNDHPAESFGASSTRAGQAFHINFAACYELLEQGQGKGEQDACTDEHRPSKAEKHLCVGLNGYYLKQTTPAEIDGNAVPNSFEQVLGLGPGMVYSPAKGTYFFLNLYLESQVRNRPEGTSLVMRFAQKF